MHLPPVWTLQTKKRPPSKRRALRKLTAPKRYRIRSTLAISARRKLQIARLLLRATVPWRRPELRPSLRHLALPSCRPNLHLFQGRNNRLAKTRRPLGHQIALNVLLPKRLRHFRHFRRGKTPSIAPFTL